LAILKTNLCSSGCIKVMFYKILNEYILDMSE